MWGRGVTGWFNTAVVFTHCPASHFCPTLGPNWFAALLLLSQQHVGVTGELLPLQICSNLTAMHVVYWYLHASLHKYVIKICKVIKTNTQSVNYGVLFFLLISFQWIMTNVSVFVLVGGNSLSKCFLVAFKCLESQQLCLIWNSQPPTPPAGLSIPLHLHLTSPPPSPKPRSVGGVIHFNLGPDMTHWQVHSAASECHKFTFNPPTPPAPPSPRFCPRLSRIWYLCFCVETSRAVGCGNYTQKLHFAICTVRAGNGWGFAMRMWWWWWWWWSCLSCRQSHEMKLLLWILCLISSRCRFVGCLCQTHQRRRAFKSASGVSFSAFAWTWRVI